MICGLAPRRSSSGSCRPTGSGSAGPCRSWLKPRTATGRRSGSSTGCPRVVPFPAASDCAAGSRRYRAPTGSRGWAALRTSPTRISPRARFQPLEAAEDALAHWRSFAPSLEHLVRSLAHALDSRRAVAWTRGASGRLEERVMWSAAGATRGPSQTLPESAVAAQHGPLARIAWAGGGESCHECRLRRPRDLAREYRRGAHLRVEGSSVSRRGARGCASLARVGARRPTDRRPAGGRESQALGSRARGSSVCRRWVRRAGHRPAPLRQPGHGEDALHPRLREARGQRSLRGRRAGAAPGPDRLKGRSGRYITCVVG
jgi:hypothetical protein